MGLDERLKAPTTKLVDIHVNLTPEALAFLDLLSQQYGAGSRGKVLDALLMEEKARRGTRKGTKR